jgi:hypothetical protein
LSGGNIFGAGFSGGKIFGAVVWGIFGRLKIILGIIFALLATVILFA